MTRHLYSILLLAMTPILIGHVSWKYWKEGLSANILRRLGLQPPPNQRNSVWIHACSLGEAKVAIQLSDAILEQKPKLSIQFTATTPSGINFIKSHNRPVAIFPWDFTWIWRRWIKVMKPRALVIIETELWPNLIHVCEATATPVVLANGRLSEKSFQKYRKWISITGPMWASVNCALMQDTKDLERAFSLGTPRSVLSSVGSIKLDQEFLPPDPLLLKALKIWKDNRKVVCLMSSHEGDDVLVLNTFSDHAPASMALLIVPRHPIRSVEITRIAQTLNLKISKVCAGISRSSVLIGDTLGQMSTYLDIADVVLIGGSFSGKGGQNPIEAAVLKKALIAGPSMYNFQSINDALVQCGGLIQVEPIELYSAINKAILDSKAIGSNARAWVDRNKGSARIQAAAVLATLRTNKN